MIKVDNGHTIIASLLARSSFPVRLKATRIVLDWKYGRSKRGMLWSLLLALIMLSAA